MYIEIAHGTWQKTGSGDRRNLGASRKLKSRPRMRFPLSATVSLGILVGSGIITRSSDPRCIGNGVAGVFHATLQDVMGHAKN